MSFIKVRCKKCGYEQIVNETASIIVHCLNCKTVIQIPKGGKAKIINVAALENHNELQ